MNPIAITLLLVVGWGAFAYSSLRRWRLMTVGAKENRSDQPAERIRRTIKYGIAQLRMQRYPLAGFAHMLIFSGFTVLLLRTLILWGRGYDESFNFWFFGPQQTLGHIYSFLKDLFAVLVIFGALVFVYFRVFKRLGRMTLSTEGLVILGIIVVMMVADICYDGASIALTTRTPPPITRVARPKFNPLESSLTEIAAKISPEKPHPSKTNGPLMVTPRRFPGEPNKREVITMRDVMDERGNVIGQVPVSTYRELSPDELAALEPVPVAFTWHEPAGSLAAQVVEGLSDDALVTLKHLGFWTHSALVLIFLNLLPYSKHFHVITGIPNVYTQSLHPPGRLPPIEDIDGKLEREETLGIRKINEFSWKSILDFYTCTECGRCSDFCPATKTGKKLSPKHFVLDLRDFLYKNEAALVAAKSKGDGNAADGESAPQPSGSGQSDANGALPEHDKDLVDGVIDPEVLWACTTCRACEQECPVFITFVDKIVDMRRYLVQERGEFPNELQTAFRGLESTLNPWNFPAEDRAKWADGLNIKTIAENPDAPVLFWIGCSPSFDERAKKVTQATAKLMQKAGVDFAILGQEEACTGDPARRAGNEYLFQMLARQNVEKLNGYGVDKKKIVTSCPHCFNTLLNEYPDFGGKYDVVHHTTFLAELVKQGKLKPVKRIDKKVVYHDSCYLGRYNEVYDAPREVLGSIPGLTILEPKETRDRGMCCGAGGAQMFKEEEPGTDRVNDVRTQQLLDTKPDAISSACPFCMRMLTDGLAGKNREEVPQLDVAEMLLESVEEKA